MTTSKFRPEMITEALQAAEAMRDTPLATKLKANGFTPARMEKEAADLTELQTLAVAARNAAVQATADLAARAGRSAAVLASYANLVRALTVDPGLRRKHGVKSPGLRKGPLFRRPRKGPREDAASAASGDSAPHTTTQRPSAGATSPITTSVIGHA